MVSAQRSTDLVSLFERPHTLHCVVQPFRHGENRHSDENMNRTITEMATKAKINKKLASTLCSIFRSMNPEEQLASGAK